MASPIEFRLGLIAALLPMVACRSELDMAPAPSAEAEHLSATALNNRGVELLRDGMLAQHSGDEDRANQAFRAALDCLEQAIASAKAGDGRDYDKAWANKAYVLWRMRRWDEAAAAAAEARRISPEYVLHRSFVDAMAAAGHPIASGAPYDWEHIRKLTNSGFSYYDEENPFEE